jgi:hypothetical protein
MNADKAGSVKLATYVQEPGEIHVLVNDDVPLLVKTYENGTVLRTHHANDCPECCRSRFNLT